MSLLYTSFCTLLAHRESVYTVVQVSVEQLNCVWRQKVL